MQKLGIITVYSMVQILVTEYFIYRRYGHPVQKCQEMLVLFTVFVVAHLLWDWLQGQLGLVCDLDVPALYDSGDNLFGKDLPVGGDTLSNHVVTYCSIPNELFAKLFDISHIKFFNCRQVGLH